MEQEYESPSESTPPRKLYFIGLALFITTSVALTLWAFITLAVTGRQ